MPVDAEGDLRMVELQPAITSDALRDLRLRLGVSVEELAADISVPAETLAAVEVEPVVHMRADYWTRLREQLPILQKPEYDLESVSMSRFERGLTLASTGHLRQAEEVLATLLLDNTINSYLKVRATLWVAGIRRDRFELDGEFGALALYERALRAAARERRRPDVTELHLLIGACHEMSKNTLSAIDHYQHGLNSATSARSTVRFHTRIGAILTKEGDYSTALEHLNTSTRASADLDDSFPYSFAYEKRALLYVASGEYDRAYRDLEEARSAIDPDSNLRLVQSITAEAHLLAYAGEPHQAGIRLHNAAALAEQHEFFHQLRSIHSLQSTLSASGLLLSAPTAGAES